MAGSKRGKPRGRRPSASCARRPASSPLEFYQLDTINTFYLASDDSVWNCPGFCAVVDSQAAITLNEEHDEFRWTARPEFLTQLMWPGERAACAELCREILDNGPAKPYLRLKPVY